LAGAEVACFEFVEDGVDVTDAPGATFGDAEPEVQEAVGFGGSIHQPLVGSGVLNDDLGMAVHGQHGGTPRSLELGNAGVRVTLKIGQWLDVIQAKRHFGCPHPTSLLKE